MMMWIIVGSIAWVLTGLFGVVMDYTADFDLTTCDLAPIVLFGTGLGPFAVLVWLIVRLPACDRGRILIRRRK